MSIISNFPAGDAQGRKDVTGRYEAWTPPTGVGKTVPAFAATLADGSYRLLDEYEQLFFVDILTVYGIQWRILREYNDEFCYFNAFCGETLAFSAGSEVGCVNIGGRQLLNEDNIPLPKREDVGKVLMAKSQSIAQWTAARNYVDETAEYDSYKAAGGELTGNEWLLTLGDGDYSYVSGDYSVTLLRTVMIAGAKHQWMQRYTDDSTGEFVYLVNGARLFGTESMLMTESSGYFDIGTPIGVLEPTADSNPATKKYVDTQISGAIAAAY